MVSQGKGVCIYYNGDKFDGYWSNDQRKVGVLWMKNGDKYDGEFKDDKFQGKGIFY